MEEKCRSTLPDTSIAPMTISQTKKAAPEIRCTIAAASTHISCMAIPITADAGAIPPYGAAGFPLPLSCHHQSHPRRSKAQLASETIGGMLLSPLTRV